MIIHDIYFTFAQYRLVFHNFLNIFLCSMDINGNLKKKMHIYKHNMNLLCLPSVKTEKLSERYGKS